MRAVQYFFFASHNASALHTNGAIKRFCWNWGDQQRIESNDVFCVVNLRCDGVQQFWLRFFSEIRGTRRIHWGARRYGSVVVLLIQVVVLSLGIERKTFIESEKQSQEYKSLDFLFWTSPLSKIISRHFLQYIF